MARRALNVEARGLREARIGFAQFGDNYDRRVTAEHRRIGRIMQTSARILVPRRTGRLAASIKADANRWSSRLYSSAVYAGPIHWGWATRPNPERGWRGGPIAPNPFLTDAMYASRPQWEDDYRHFLSNVIDSSF